MSSSAIPALLAGLSMVLAACGGGSGSGNSGGGPRALSAVSVTSDGTVSAAAADVSRADDGRIVLSMTDGPMSGMTILCVDHSLGACSVVGGGADATGEGTLLARMSGQFAYVGRFSVLHLDRDGNSYATTHLAHGRRPGAPDENQRLPAGVIGYTGAFSGGVALASGTTGVAEGSAAIVADFNTATLSGQFEGSVRGGDEAVNASFNNVTINAKNGQFMATDDTVILFQGSRADGDINGAFYGPNAEELGGIFDFGNEAGSINGIFLACKGSNPSCITY